MIKNLTKTLILLTIVSQSLLFSPFETQFKVLALSQEQVVEKLSTITVFTIANQKGDMLLVQNQDKKNIALLYLSQQEAQKATEQFKQKNPQESFQVIPVAFSELYQLVKERAGQQDTPLLTLIPVQRQVDAAKTLLRQQNQPVSEFEGVPLFYVTYQQEQQEVFLTAKSGEQNVIPLSFEKEPLQNQVEQIKKQQPDIASTIQIRVLTLESLIGILEQQDNEAVRKMIVVPSQETLAFLRQLQQQQQQKQR